MQEFKSISKTFWCQNLLGRRYFVASSGNVTDEAIMEYIKTKEKAEEFNKEDGFSIE